MWDMTHLSVECDTFVYDTHVKNGSILCVCGTRICMWGNDSRMSGTKSIGEVGGWGRVPFSRNLMSPTPRRKWYLKTGRRAH